MAVYIFIALLGGTAFAQQAAPSDADIMQLRAYSAEAQVSLLAAMVRHMEAQHAQEAQKNLDNPQATADWWAAYAAAAKRQ